MSRLTIDMEPEDYRRFKRASDACGLTLEEFLRQAILEKIEDVFLIENAQETLRRIESGKEKTISWNKMKQRLAQPNLEKGGI